MAVTTAAARLPLAGTFRRASCVTAYLLAVYRRTWRGSIITSFASPVLFLASMGLGLGSLVTRHAGAVEGMTYLTFVATGMLGVAVMQTSVTESTYPTLSRIQWTKVYEAVLSTPLRIPDLVLGEVLWLVVRTLMVSVIFTAVMAAFGVLHTWSGLLAVPIGVLTGLAFACPVLAFTATRRQDHSFSSLQRFGVMPLFLLSGTFFSISRLPVALRVVAWIAPLSHGTVLVRAAVHGGGSAATDLLHLAVLLVYAGGGMAAAFVTFRRRLLR